MTAPNPTVGELSEGTILRSILDRVSASHAVVGPGDDAAVLAAPDGRIVATVDTLVHGPDFRLEWSSAADLGWKAAAVNLADIAAMGARPIALLVALALPADTRLSFVESFAAGIDEACDHLAPGCRIEGGDLTVSDTLTIAITALGVLDGAEPVLRGGARPGDVVAVAGELGVAARGLAVLFERFDGVGTVDEGTIDALTLEDAAGVRRQLRPDPPVRSGPVAASSGATAMIDVSDGLALDASRLAAASGVTLDLWRAALGPDPDLALSGGEDHALLATFPAQHPLPAGFRAIGEVVDRAAAPATIDGIAYAGRTGWDPYRDHGR